MATNLTNDLLTDKTVLQFPTGIPYEDEYVMFKINTDEKSTALRTDKKSEKDILVSSRRTGTGTSSSTFIRSINEDPDLNTRFGKENVDKTVWLRQKGMRSLNKVIVLPMPNDHNVRTSIAYNDQHDPGFLTKLGDAINQSGALAGELGRLAKNYGISTIINQVTSTFRNKDITSVNQMLAEDRVAMNPKKEVMFNDFGFRSFNLDYTFAPKSAQEAEMVRSIIETFRYYALPEISEAKMFYIFPSEFEIIFLKGQKDNPFIPRITTCVLKAINVNYSPQGLWSSLPNGSPVAMRVTMEFLEMELVDRGRVWNKEPLLSGY